MVDMEKPAGAVHFDDVFKQNLSYSLENRALKKL